MSRESPPLWRRLVDGWTAIAARFGAVQTTLLLALFYVVLLGPVALVLRVARRDPLDKRHLGGGDTAWKEANTAGSDLERAKLLS